MFTLAPLGSICSARFHILGSLYRKVPCAPRGSIARALVLTHAPSPLAAPLFTDRGKYAVVTGAPSVVGKISFVPPLPPLKQQLARDAPMGNAVRIYAVYSWPWWRSQALSGSFTDESTGAVLQFGFVRRPMSRTHAL